MKGYSSRKPLAISQALEAKIPQGGATRRLTSN